MNILITNAYSLEQKGDSSLLAGTIDQLKKAFPQAHLQAQIMNKIKAGERYNDVPIMESMTFVALASDRKGLRRFFLIAYRLPACILWAWIARATGNRKKLFISEPMRQSMSAICDADLIVPVAGGYITGEPVFLSSANLIFILLPIWIAHIVKKPVIHFSQSIGPLQNGFQRFMVRKTLVKAKLIITRESVSAQFVKDLGVDPKKVYESIDIGFLFAPANNFKPSDALGATQRLPDGKKTVGITTKIHLAPEEQARYERAVATFADWLCAKKHMAVIFIPQITSSELGEDDRITNRRVHALMQNGADAIVIEKNLTNHETKSLIDSLDYMVGTRFHSVIFALTGGVPSIAIEYEHKTIGIMRDLRLAEWVLPMKGLTAEKLSTMFDALVMGKKQYRAHLAAALPKYIQRADDVIARIQGTFQS